MLSNVVTREIAAHNQRARIIWQLRVDGVIARRPLALGDGILVPMMREGDIVVRRIHVFDGGTEWETVLDGPGTTDIARTGSTVIVPLTGGRLASLRLEDGMPTEWMWDRVMGEFTDPITARGGRCFVRLMPGTGARLACFEAHRERPLWDIADPAHGATGSRLITTAGLLIEFNEDGGQLQMTAINLVDGRVRWKNRDIQGRLLDVYACAGILDVLTDKHGVTRVDIETGLPRNRRLSSFPFDNAMIVGEALLMEAIVKNKRALFSFGSVGESVISRLRNQPIAEITSASTTEALVRLETGLPAFYSLPDLRPIAFPEAESAGPTERVVWTQYVAYLISEDRHTITAVELDAG